MDTPQFQIIRAMLEPVYARATDVYNKSVIGRLVTRSVAEGLVKNGYPPSTAPGFHETIQSAVARVRPTVETVNAQMSNTGVYPITPGG
jgi:hypothetical protein